MSAVRIIAFAMLCCSSLAAEMYLGEPTILESYRCYFLSQYGGPSDSGYHIYVESYWGSPYKYVDVRRTTQSTFTFFITCNLDTLNAKELKLRCDNNGQPVILAIDKETLKANLDHLYTYKQAKALGFYDDEDVVPGGLLRINPDSLVSSRQQMVCRKD